MFLMGINWFYITKKHLLKGAFNMHQYNVLKYDNLDDLCGVIILCDEHQEFKI